MSICRLSCLRSLSQVFCVWFPTQCSHSPSLSSSYATFLGSVSLVRLPASAFLYFLLSIRASPLFATMVLSPSRVLTPPCWSAYSHTLLWPHLSVQKCLRYSMCKVNPELAHDAPCHFPRLLNFVSCRVGACWPAKWIWDTVLTVSQVACILQLFIPFVPSPFPIQKCHMLLYLSPTTQQSVLTPWDLKLTLLVLSLVMIMCTVTMHRTETSGEIFLSYPFILFISFLCSITAMQDAEPLARVTSVPGNSQWMREPLDSETTFKVSLKLDWNIFSSHLLWFWAYLE